MVDIFVLDTDNICIFQELVKLYYKLKYVYYFNNINYIR